MQVTPYNTTGTAIGGNDTVRVAKKTLGQDDFMKILATQFQTQDPMKPIEDTAFIAQMAQFSALEQASAVTREISLLRGSQDVATANSYLGHLVTVGDPDGEVVQGEVAGIEVTGGVPRLVIGDHTYALSSVLYVEPKPAPAPPPAESTT